MPNRNRRALTRCASLLWTLSLLLTGALAEEGAPRASDKEEHVVVTGRRAPAAFSETARHVTVITREEIEAAPVQDLAALLEHVAALDVRQRGSRGVQADLSLRGSTFEQVLLLVDGVKVSDPQTGHHLMDLPVTLEDIERIEILGGPGSRLYGPNAFGGVVHVITRRPAGEELSLRGELGSHGARRAHAAAGFAGAGGTHRLSAARSRADGERENTDFTIENIAWTSRWERGADALRLQAGHTDKRFGARDFYSARFPWQWEATKTSYASLSGERRREKSHAQLALSYRRHDDEFLLDRRDPGFYRNLHRSDVLSLEGQFSVATRLGTLALGGELGREELDSNSLGQRERDRSGLFVEQEITLGPRAELVVGAFAHHTSDWGWELSPGAELGVRLGEGLRLYGSAGRAFRVPTYTELYYASPANIGNPELEPEEAWSYEGGLRFERGRYRGELTLFYRDAEQLIDWVLDPETDVWQATNLTAVETRGVELDSRFAFGGRRALGVPLRALNVSYAYLDADKDAFGATSRYALQHLRHKAVATLRFGQPGAALTPSVTLRFEDRLTAASYLLVDARVAWRRGPVELYLAGSNLGDRSYEELPGLVAPGRWVHGGVVYRPGR